MNDEKLIKLVRSYPVLYDLANPRYMDTEFKNTIWTKMGKEMKISGSLCKTRWGNIRDNFRKSIKKSITISGQKAKCVKVYKYSEQLNFLKKYFAVRETRSNIDSEEINRDLSSEKGVECMDDVQIMGNTQQIVQDDDSRDNSQHSIGQISRNTSPTQIDCLRRTKSSKRQKTYQTNPPKTAAATVMEYLIKQNESMNPPSTQSSDPVDAFLNGIAPALQKLPLRYWHYAKSEIFAAVQKYELKMLVDEEERAQSSQIYINKI